MEVRVKSVHNAATQSYSYKVQIKNFLFWKTLMQSSIWDEVEKFVDTLDQVEKFNKRHEKQTIDVYGVRQPEQYTHGYSDYITFFAHKPVYRESYPCSTSSKGKWEGKELCTLKQSELFGERVLEPQRFRITIEKL